jgi:HD-GYP domain-containing protein (c-di-GMP phosphodiesterase class II)
VSVPVAWGGRVRCFLSASACPEPGPGESGAFAALGRITAAVLEHADMAARIEPSVRVRTEAMGAAMRQRVEASADAIDERDGYRPGRRLRVAALARQVGERIGMASAELDQLETAARLHNAGKAKLPDVVLAKAGRLEPDERELVALHPEWGAEMLARVPGLGPAAAVVLFHRERPDGSGYPYGLRGDRIPLPSCIIGACDALDAMLSDRPYRMRLEPGMAAGELRAGAARHFDREVVEAVLAA